MFLEVVKTQDLTSKIWQALRDAIKQSIFNTFANFTWQLFFLSCTFA
jgi:phosphoserine aminotransferase